MSEREVHRGYRDSIKIIDGVRIPYRVRPYEYPTTPNNDTTSTFEKLVVLTFKEAQEILLSKHHDYGPTNIANAPGGALNGLRVRIHDKTARINNLIDNKKDAQHESLRDSFLDLMNYAAIALLVLDGNWPGVEPDDTEADCG